MAAAWKPKAGTQSGAQRVFKVYLAWLSDLELCMLLIQAAEFMKFMRQSFGRERWEVLQMLHGLSQAYLRSPSECAAA